MAEEVLPLRAHEIDGPARHAEVHLEKDGAADPRLLHRRQVRGHAVARELIFELLRAQQEIVGVEVRDRLVFEALDLRTLQ